DKQAFARTIFSEIIFDLDTRRIVDFKMAPYAEAFLQMRVTLEEFNRQQNASAENDAGSSEEYTPLPLRILEMNQYAFPRLTIPFGSLS
ncbi:MAG: hypothetical protein IT323_02670, partial [Anaerolineae bacterium]|nr:hypothetical protein [Anaerolineae bacterium]